MPKPVIQTHSGRFTSRYEIGRRTPRARLEHIVRTMRRLSKYLAATDPALVLRPLEKAPSKTDWPTFPVKTKTKDRPSVESIPVSKSEALQGLVHDLRATIQRSKDLAKDLKAAKKQLADTFAPQIQETDKAVYDKAQALWSLLEKNHKAITEGEEIFTRTLGVVLGARGVRKEVVPPEKMPPDPRVDAAIQFIAEHVPGLLDEFQRILDKLEDEYVQAQPEESRTVVHPPELAIYDLEAQASLQKRGGIWSALYEWASSVYRSVRNFLSKAREFNVGLTQILEGDHAQG